jgi:D-alanine transaminase
MTPIVYFNGAFMPKENVRLSPDDRGFLFADGVYEVVRSYGGSFFALEPHLRRLGDGMRALRIEGVTAAELGPVCQELLNRNGLDSTDALVYMQVTRGVAPRTHAFPNPPVTPTVYATTKPFETRADPAVGVSVITAPDRRWTRCDIKSVSLLANCLAAQLALEQDAVEALLVRDGVVLEGTHTGFFGVFDGVVQTAPRSNYILPSITRQTTIDLCVEHNIPVREAPIFVEALPDAGELFLAGTTLELMPIVSVDGNRVADGTPGPVAGRLLELFRTQTG